MSVAFNPNGRVIASASYDGTIQLWNLSGKSLDILDGYPDRMIEVLFSPDGKTISYVSNLTRDARLVKIIENGQESFFSDLEGYVKDTGNVILFTPNNEAVVNARDSIKLWNLRDRLLRTITFHSSVSDVSDISRRRRRRRRFSKAGTKGFITLNNKNNFIATTKSNNATIELWNFDGKLLNTFTTISENISNIEFSHDGNILASINDDNTIALWNTKGKLIRAFEVDSQGINSLIFSPNSKLIAFTFNSKRKNNHNAATSRSNLDRYKIELRNLQGDLLHILEGHSDYIYQVIFSPDGQNIASVSADNTVKLWDSNGRLINTLESPNNDISRVVFSPDGKLVAAFNDDHYGLYSSNFNPSNFNEDEVIKLWDRQGNLINTINNSKDAINDLEFIPEKKVIISAGYDGEIKFWSYQGQLVQTLTGRNDSITDLELIPDKKIIISADVEHKIKLWNYQGQLLQTLKGHMDTVDNVVFHSDSKTIASSSSSDGTVKLWSLDLDEVMSRGCNWVRDYLENNPNVSDEDRKICDGY